MLFANKVLLKNKQFLCLYMGVGANGTDFYSYILTTLPQFEQMERDIKIGKSGINVFSYGEVVEFGKGEPRDEVKALMQEKYNFTH